MRLGWVHHGFVHQLAATVVDDYPQQFISCTLAVHCEHMMGQPMMGGAHLIVINVPWL
jgi:hypothetical protein